MFLYRISKCPYINDLSGTGAAKFGGRWNSPGTYVVYTAGSAALAMLEAVVHMGGDSIATGYCQLVLTLPEDLPMQTIDTHDLPDNWQDNPSPDNLRAIGDTFVARNQYALLRLPSVIVPEEHNYLLNPAHKDFKRIKPFASRSLRVDERLV